jgi:hypothetical protein
MASARLVRRPVPSAVLNNISEELIAITDADALLVEQPENSPADEHPSKIRG